MDHVANLDLIKSRGEADIILSEYIDQKFLRSFLLQNLELVDGKYKWSINLKAIKKSHNDLINGHEQAENHGISHDVEHDEHIFHQLRLLRHHLPIL